MTVEPRVLPNGKAILVGVWDLEPLSADTMARELVHRRLLGGLGDAGVEEAFGGLAGVDGDLDKAEVTRDVLAREDEVLSRLAPLLDSWRRADASLAAANERVARGLAALKLDFVIPISAGLSLTVLLGAIVCAYFIDLRYLFRGIALATLLAMPLGLGVQRKAHLRRLSSWFDRKRAREAAEERFEFAAATQATVTIRETINERLISFSTNFRILDQRGLRSLADPEREVSTAASEELTTLVTSLSSGSIGLSGPRGSGKTTLINSFARGRSVPFARERLGLVVSAPVKYDAKEFVLHLFAALCESVIGEGRLDSLTSTSAASLRGRNEIRLSRLLELGTLIFAAASGAMLVFHRVTPEGPRETGIVLLVVAGLLFLGSIYFWFRADLTWPNIRARLLFRFSGEGPIPSARTPERTARDYLEQIRFQQSVSSGWSGSIKLPLGVGIGRESSVTSARAPWSLPEAVEAFRKYAESLTTDRYLVIGIDELDKMGSDDTAREFLNNVKGVFGVGGCYYLVSVSDDAMASFERRGMPVRDVFDSSFDAVQRIGYLTLVESRAVLDSRVIGLPVPYQCLCHCMAGGLARDLIRVTRELVHQAEKKGATSLEELTHAVVEAELRAKIAGAVEESRGLTGNDGKWVRKWLDPRGGAATVADELRDGVARLTEWGGLKRGAPELAFQVAAFDYYAATVLELFRDDSDFVESLQASPWSTEVSPEAVAVLEALARARQRFAISPDLAWESVAALREELPLSQWEDPRQTRGFGWDIASSPAEGEAVP